MPAPKPLLQLWYRWKALRLPWRRQFLAGHDLAGNTFWEFKDAANANRLRRIVKYTKPTTHYADIQISRKHEPNQCVGVQIILTSWPQRNGTSGSATLDPSRRRQKSSNTK
jgi:hypothetical protein